MRRLVTKYNPGVSQLRLHSWIVVFAFGMKKRGLHENHVRFPGRLVGNNGDSEMPIKERPSRFRPSTTVIVGVAVVVFCMVGRAAITVTLIVTGGAGIAVAVTVISRAGIAIDFAATINNHCSVADEPTLCILACIQVNIVHLMLFVALTINDRKIISRLAQFLVEFDSGIKQ